MVTGTSAVLGVAVVVAASLALGAPPLPGGGTSATAGAGTGLAVKASAPPTTTSPSGTPKSAEPPPAALLEVSLPDPAPGFPLRRWTDDVGLETVGSGERPHWTALFGLGVQPDNADGTPGGPQVTLRVGDFPMPANHGGTIEGHDVVASPEVAGVQGHVTLYSEKGTAIRELYFSTGTHTVEVIGFGGVSTDQLVALGDALQGLR